MLFFLVATLETDTNISVPWFNQDYMVSNAEEVQGIILYRLGHTINSIDVNFDIWNQIIFEKRAIKVYGAMLDASLDFIDHIKNIRFQTSGQINTFPNYLISLVIWLFITNL